MLACLLLAAGAARRSAVLTAAKAQPTTQLLFHERLIAGAGRAFVAGRQVVSELFALVREVSRVASLLMRS